MLEVAEGGTRLALPPGVGLLSTQVAYSTFMTFKKHLVSIKISLAKAWFNKK